MDNKEPQIVIVEPNLNPNSLTDVKNPFWNGRILIVNLIGLVISLFLLFTIDLEIAHSGNVGGISLWTFWWEMVGVIIFNVVCLIGELYFGQDLVKTPVTGDDKAVFTLVILRNILLVLNCIPFIQILGILLGILILPLITILEVVSVTSKFHIVKNRLIYFIMGIIPFFIGIYLLYLLFNPSLRNG